MSDFDNTNRGILFRQTEKKSEKAPDYKGKVNVDGRDLELAGWIREGKSGKFLSLKVSEPFKKGEKAEKAPAKPAQSFADEPNDEIPF